MLEPTRGTVTVLEVLHEPMQCSKLKKSIMHKNGTTIIF
jgi:hypothetical protein